MSDKKYSYKEVYSSSLEYFNGDELAAKVFADKYSLQNEVGEFLECSLEDTLKRSANEFSRVENKYPNPLDKKVISDYLLSKTIMPQGSPISGIGNPYQVMSISNCFVLESPYDSYGGIMKTDQEEAHLMRRRGGVGFDLSNIRPADAPCKNAAKTTTGILPYMERYSNTCREVAQNGRRGALMLTISVHHPEIITFINAKRDLKKVTGANISVKVTDEFMNAVKNKEKLHLRWPVDAKAPSIEKWIDAEEVWDILISAAHSSAEPGILFWDTATKYTPSDIYKDFGFASVSTNPCLTGDVKIAVADGRGFVSIKDLADAELDVPVFANENGKVTTKMMRNPRITGYDKDVYEVKLDDGSIFKCTDNHKLLMSDGSYQEVKNLAPGDSLHVAWRYEASIKDIWPGANAKSQNYIWMKTVEKKTPKTEHRLIYEFYNGEIPKKNVIHHIDFNAQNNSINNLRSMTKLDHDALHADHMRGENNPIHKLKADPERYAVYRAKQSANNKAEGNSKFSGFSSDEIKNFALELTRKLNRKFSSDEWQTFAKEKGLPQAFSSWRKNELGTIGSLAIWSATECGVENIEYDPRLVKTLKSALEQGYEAFIKDDNGGNLKAEIFVNKICEECSNKFEISYNRREQGFCGQSCSAYYVGKTTDANARRTHKLQKTYANKVELNKKEQVKIYLDLKFNLKRNPWLKEWEQACKKQNISFRLRGAKNSFQSWDELKEEAGLSNHRIVSVTFVGKENVYNGTVDDVHNFYFGGFESSQQNGKKQWCLVNSRNCGEIVLSPYDSCRLLLLNLTKFVKNEFTKQSKFDFDEYKKAVVVAQRLMDDLIDLELECIDRILNKIESDPEPDDVKKNEKDLWNKIKNACITGRRTGLGITGLGDCLAMLNIKYGDDKSIEMTEEIYKELAINAYKSTCILASERGKFPIFSHDLEKNHPFLQRIWDASPEVYELYKKHGRRNIAISTTAPCGSISILTQTTSGIEPAYMLSYKRRKKINPSSKDAKIDFVDASGDSWQEFTVHHHGLQKWMDATGETDITKSPYWGATALDVGWENGVKLQAAAQKWICHSISRTANLPEHTTVEAVKTIYMKAWELGCKGYTCYRENSRSGVLFSEESSKKDKKTGRPVEVIQAESPKRPAELPCEIHSVTFKGTKWTVLVGLLKDHPYEMFMGHSEQIFLPSKCSTGNLVKVGKGKYNLHVDIAGEDLVVKDVIKTFDNAESAWATRMMSTALRHGVPVDFLTDQLSKDGLATDFNKVIARILKKYIKDGSKVRSSQSCSNVLENGTVCGNTELVFQEGCLTCKSCGYSKCG